MVLLLMSIPEFSTMCKNAQAAFESINTCKGAVFDSLNCNELAWFSDSRDEGVEVEAEFGQSCQASKQVGAATSLRQPVETPPSTYGESHNDTLSISSSINPAIIESSYHAKQRHIKLDSATIFQAYDDDEIFRSRQASQGSDSQCFRLCRLDRCQAFSSSQDSEGDSSSDVHPLKRDPATVSGGISEIRMVHWDELLEENSVVNSRILE
jgi:hypothetical protein